MLEQYLIEAFISHGTERVSLLSELGSVPAPFTIAPHDMKQIEFNAALEAQRRNVRFWGREGATLVEEIAVVCVSDRTLRETAIHFCIWMLDNGKYDIFNLLARADQVGVCGDSGALAAYNRCVNGLITHNAYSAIAEGGYAIHHCWSHV